MSGSKTKSKPRSAPLEKHRTPKPKPAASNSVVEMAAVAVSSKRRQKNAEIEYARDGRSCVISHEERFATILGSTSFAVNSYAINPGQSSTFPWLSGIANRFESYRFDKLEFLYKTKTATTALGDVILAVDYDATDAAPTDSIQAEAYDESVSSAPWQNLTHKCRAQNMRKLPTYYVRGDSQPSSTDLKLYDMGNLFVCTENQASAALVGYMYVRYTVRLLTPQLRSNDFGIAGGSYVGTTACTAANPMGTSPVADGSNRGWSVNAASRITFDNPGTYLLFHYTTGTTLSASALANGSGVTSSSLGGTANAAATGFTRAWSVVTTGASQYVDFTVTAATVTGTSLYLGSSPFGSHALVASNDLSFEACRKRIQARNAGLMSKCPDGCACSKFRPRPDLQDWSGMPTKEWTETYHL